MGPARKYDVTDARVSRSASFSKVFGKSLLRSTWRIYDATGEEIALGA